MPNRPSRAGGWSRADRLALLSEISDRAFFPYVRCEPLPITPSMISRLRSITCKELINYRIDHPGPILRYVIAGLLRERQAIDAGGDDIVVPTTGAEPWMNRELFICAACLRDLELHQFTLWSPEGMDHSSDGYQAEGHLLVEEHKIIGGAKFALLEDGWNWQFVWIHPEYRRRGYLSRRLQQWLNRYGPFIADQPNAHTSALLAKGWKDQIRIKPIPHNFAVPKAMSAKISKKLARPALAW